MNLAKAERANFSHALEAKVKKIVRNILRRANQPKADRQGFIRAKIQSARSGEHRLPACSRRQPADEPRITHRFARTLGLRAFEELFGKAAEKDRLAACAPQMSTARPNRFTDRDHRS